MKTTAQQMSVPLGKTELEMMTKEVKEILAFDDLKQHRIFSSVDLWNIQRRRKNISLRKNVV